MTRDSLYSSVRPMLTPSSTFLHAVYDELRLYSSPGCIVHHPTLAPVVVIVLIHRSHCCSGLRPQQLQSRHISLSHFWSPLSVRAFGLSFFRTMGGCCRHPSVLDKSRGRKPVTVWRLPCQLYDHEHRQTQDSCRILLA